MKMRPLADSDWPSFCSFAEKYFGNSHNQDRIFNEHWFKTHHYDGWSAMILEAENGCIAGIMMAIVTPAWFAGEITQMAWISTGVVEPKARARGAGAQLFMWIYKTFPLVGALSGNDFSNPMNSTLGNEIPNVSIRRFINVHNIKTANLCQPSGQKWITNIDLTLGTQTSPKLTSRWVDHFPHDYNDLYQKFSKPLIMTTNRSQEYLLWRYINAPYIDYKILEVRLGDKLGAVATMRFQKTPEGLVCRIVDFIVDPELSENAWLQVAMEAANKEALFSDFFVIGSGQDKALEAAGFRAANETTNLDSIPHLLSPVEHRKWSNTVHIGGKLLKKNNSWKSSRNLYFTKADSDRDWPTPFDLRE